MKIGIVGGGFMGVVLAYKLSQKGASVKVFEGGDQVGGLTTHHDYEDFIWDRFYHVILPTDSQLIGLVKELGLEDSLHWRRTFTGYFVQNKFHSLSNVKDFLLFPPLGLLSKLKLAFTIFYGSKITNWRLLEKITVEEWLVKVGGRKTYEKFWLPLILAKLGDNHRKASAVFIWSYIRRMFQARDSSSQKEHMAYVTGGYKTIFDRFVQLLEEKGSEMMLNTAIKSIDADPGGGINLSYEDKVENFDKVIFTAPLNILKKTTSPELIEISNVDEPVEYLGVVCLVLITRKPLTPYYILNIADSSIPFTGVIGMSSLVDLDETAGLHITYFPKYVSSDDPIWQKKENELKDIFLDGVYRLYPELNKEDIVSTHINKALKVQPLQVINYSEIIPQIETKHKDFFVLNTSQFVNDTLNNNSVAKHVSHFVESFNKELETDHK